MKKRFTELELSTMFQQVFNGKNGKEVLKWFEERYENNTSYVSGDPHGTTFNEGQRSVYLQVKQFMGVDTKELEKLEKELKAEAE